MFMELTRPNLNTIYMRTRQEKHEERVILFLLDNMHHISNDVEPLQKIKKQGQMQSSHEFPLTRIDDCEEREYHA